MFYNRVMLYIRTFFLASVLTHIYSLLDGVSDLDQVNLHPIQR